MKDIYVDGMCVESIKDDEKMTQMFDEFDAKVFQIAEKKFKAICKRFKKKASISIIVKFEEDKK